MSVLTSIRGVYYDNCCYLPSDNGYQAIDHLLANFTNLMKHFHCAGYYRPIGATVLLPGMESDDRRDREERSPVYIIAHGSLFCHVGNEPHPAEMMTALLSGWTEALQLLHDEPWYRGTEWQWIAEGFQGISVCFATRDAIV